MTGSAHDPKRKPGPARRRPVVCAALAAAVMALPGGARGEPLSANGMLFSDEMGGFRILSATGSGTHRDPFILVEEITEDGPVALVVRGLSTNYRRFDWSSSYAAFALIKIVINRTGTVWTGFDLELREALSRPSGYPDGLSFDQPALSGRPFRSDRFGAVHEVFEPYDRVRFRKGAVADGQSAKFDLFITDPTPRETFYVIQRGYAEEIISGLEPRAAGEPFERSRFGE